MKKLSLTLLACAMVILYISCNNNTQQKNEKTESVATTTDSTFNIRFSPFPPNELAANADSLQLVEFAWEEFLALNWKSSYEKNGLRDYPDTTWSYYSDSANPFPSLNVWETYAHRVEFRPAVSMSRFDTIPHYTYTNQPMPDSGNPSYNLFNNLDENNEIGSCNLYAHVNDYKRKYQVLYQAKVNRDEYNYVLNNYFNPANLTAAINRTAANIAKDSAYYKGAPNTCSCPKDSDVICLPCGSGSTQGSMEVKTAWRELTPKDNPAQFFTRTVIIYTKGDPKKGQNASKVYYTNKTYGLIGIHILHKTVNYPDFVIATFEQVSVQADSMGYSLIGSKGTDTSKLFTPIRNPIPAVADASTAYVHSKLPSKSIWQYYRLVGVQATPSSNTSAFSHYLANYVIESDSTLARFNGSGFANPFDGKVNTLYKGQFYTQGGCQGCHGVAQQKFGQDFSFVLGITQVSTPDVGMSHPGDKLHEFLRKIEMADKRQEAIRMAMKK